MSLADILLGLAPELVELIERLIKAIANAPVDQRVRVAERALAAITSQQASDSVLQAALDNRNKK